MKLQQKLEDWSKPRLHQLKIMTSTHSTVPTSFTDCLNLSIHTGKYHQGRGNTLCWEQMQTLTNLSSTLEFLIRFLIQSHLFSQIFMQYLTKWSKSIYLKAEALRIPQKVRTVLVWYLLLWIRILVYSCTGCGTSKMYLCLEDNRSSLSWVSLKSEIKDARP